MLCYYNIMKNVTQKDYFTIVKSRSFYAISGSQDYSLVMSPECHILNNFLSLIVGLSFSNAAATHSD